MNIIFDSQKFQKECNDFKLLQRRYGPEMAKKIRQRLDDFHAAPNLKTVFSLPGHRCHELKGDRKGQLSVDLVHPYRLIFKPANNPVPLKPDGGYEYEKITSVSIIEIADTH